MKTKDMVFDLVKSLSKQEKRYFKLHALQHSADRATVSTRLFDIMDGMEVYNEVELQDFCCRQSIGGGLALAKHKLAQALLNSLDAYAAGKSIHAKITRILRQIELLYSRGQYDFCRRQITKGLKLALNYEKHGYLFELRTWQLRLIVLERAGDIGNTLRQHFRLTREELRHAAEELRYRELMHRVMQFSRRASRSLTPNDLAELDTIADESSAREIEPPPFTLQSLYWQIHGTRALLIGDAQLAYSCFRSTIELWRRNSDRIEESPSVYLRYATNFLTCCLSLKRFDEFNEILQSMQKLHLQSHPVDVHSFERIIYLDFAYCLNCGLVERGLRTARNFEDNLARHEYAIQPKRLIMLHYNCCLIYFLAGKYPEALEHCNNVLNQSFAELKQDVRAFARLLRLVILFELDAREGLEAALLATRRFVRRRVQFSFAAAVIRAMQSLLDETDRIGTQAVLSVLYRDLVDIIHDESAKEPVGLLEMLLWADSYRRDMALAELYRSVVTSGHNTRLRDLFPRDPGEH